MNFGYFRFLRSLRGIEPRRGLFRNTQGKLTFLAGDAFGVFVNSEEELCQNLRELGLEKRAFLKGLHLEGLLVDHAAAPGSA